MKKCEFLRSILRAHISPWGEKWDWKEELTWQLHPQVCVLTGEGDRLNMTLHWLAHTRLKCEVTTGKFSWGIPYFDGRTQTPTTWKITIYVV